MGSPIQPQRTALITGAASGVGFAVAKLCRSKDMHLVLLDIDRENLRKAKETLTGMNSCLQTEAFVIDVADAEAWRLTSKQILEIFTEIDLVVLNAGKGYKPREQDVGRANPWLDVAYWRKTLETNVYGPLNGLQYLLPMLLSSRSSKSIASPTPPGGGNPAYNASKAAVKSLTEHLAHDLRSDPKTSHISVHLLIPGWTWTGFMGNGGPVDEGQISKPAGAWYPSQVAAELLNGLENRTFYIICPDGETDLPLDQARMTWGGEDVLENRPALSRWDENWATKAAETIQADAEARRASANRFRALK
ncbi:hypothetical protein N7492_002304 [Penicillium capsulatum]|uniref:Short chain dehydrogenase/reductase n=1 Tax=Penicillium capsulatum TaxID=69766 RepID=A0A9W9LVW9_9EURO|nr:hypothetical protein N7492_002304 [Penicillium capsulatum]